MIKSFLFILLLTVPLVLSQDYVVPDLEYDDTDPTCQNINALISATNSDLRRLGHYVNVTLPKRIKRLNGIINSTQTTCGLLTNPKPSLVQMSSSEAKRRLGYVHSIKKMNLQAQEIAETIFKHEHTDPLSMTFLNQLMKMMTDLSDSASVTDLCNGVYDTIPSLVDYLEWLTGAVHDKYISGILYQRIQDLTQFQAHCSSSSNNNTANLSCSLANASISASDASDIIDDIQEVSEPAPVPNDIEGGDTDDDEASAAAEEAAAETDDDDGTIPFCLSGDKLMKQGQIISLKCAGSNDPNQQYLDMFSAGGIFMSPTDNSSYPGTHWEVQVLDDGTCAFANQRSVAGYGLYLCGMAGLSVGAAPETGSWFTGSHITPAKLADGTYSLWSPATPWWDLHYITCNPEVSTDQLLNLSQNANSVKTHWIVNKVTNGPRPLFQNGSVVSIRSRAPVDEGDYTYLSAFASGQHYLVPSDNYTFLGAHWKVQVNNDGSYSFWNLLTPSLSMGGISWDLNEFQDGSYTLRYLGNSYIPRQWYFADPTSGIMSINLANNFTLGGAFWDINPVDVDPNPVLKDGQVVTIRLAGTQSLFGSAPAWTTQYLNNQGKGTVWRVRANSDNSWSFVNNDDTNLLIGGSAGGMSVSIGWEMFGGCTWEVNKYKDGTYTIRNQGNVYLPLTYMTGSTSSGIVNLTNDIGAGSYWEIEPVP